MVHNVNKDFPVARKPPDRLKSFASLTEHEAALREGKIATSDHEGHVLRRIWHEGEWWHSVNDVMGALTESANPQAYWAQLKKRLSEVEGASQLLTNCQKLKLPAADGKRRGTDCATAETMLRIIQSVPSPKAEPIKQFLARVGQERLEEIAAPSKAIDRAIQTYRTQGRDDEWIDGRLQNISARNELTDEWKARGAKEKIAVLTSQMGKEMLGVTPAEHRQMKRLSNKHETRDHMDNLELAVVTLGERAAKAIIVERDTKEFSQTRAASLDGAKIAGDARKNIEEQIGRPVANGGNFLPKPQETPELPFGGESAGDEGDDQD